MIPMPDVKEAAKIAVRSVDMLLATANDQKGTARCRHAAGLRRPESVRRELHPGWDHRHQAVGMLCAGANDRNDDQ